MGRVETNKNARQGNYLVLLKRYFLFMLREHKSGVFGVLIVLLGIVTLPWLMSIITSDSEYTGFGFYVYFGETLTVADKSLILYSRILITLIPFAVFKYLYDKNKMDRYWSLPISRSELFILNTIFSWAIVVIPTVLTYYLQIILAYLASLSGKEILLPTLSTIVIRTLVILAINLFPMVLSILSITITTSPFNGYICVATLNLIPFTIIALVEAYIYNFPGFTPSIVGMNRSSLQLLSIDTLNSRIFEEPNGINDMLAICIYVAVAIILLILAGFLYRSRKVERISSAYMFKYLYSSIVVIFVFLVLVYITKTTLFGVWDYNRDFLQILKDRMIELASIFTGGLVAFFIVNMFMRHGKVKVFRILITYTLLAVLALGVSAYGFFEWEKKLALAVPELVEIREIKLVAYTGDFSGSEAVKDAENIEVFRWAGVTNDFIEQKTRDPEDIAEIRNLHIQAIEVETGLKRPEYLAPRSSDYSEALVKIIYYDPNNELIMQREYTFYNADVELLSEIFGENVDIVPALQEFN